MPCVISMPKIDRSFCRNGWIGMSTNFLYGIARSGPRSSAGLTLVSTDTLLLALFGSATAELTLALLVSFPACLGVTTIVTLAIAPPGARLPRWQITVAPRLHEPWLGVAETSVTPDGRVSVTFTLGAVLGPALAIVS